MNILFLTLVDFSSIYERGIYTDLTRTLCRRGNNVCVISPVERSQNIETHVIKEDSCTILKLRIGNTQKTNILEKGISTIAIESLFIKAIKAYFSKVKFNLIIYSTPPITFCKAVEFVKRRDGAKTLLLLKDIFPQNAVDIGMISKTGVKMSIYKFFRRKEKKLYAISDHIGCMSPANVRYVLKHNRDIPESKVSVIPNCIEVEERIELSEEEKASIRDRYNIPRNVVLFIYGGNLGKPQDIGHIMDCLKSQRDNKKAFFLIVGNGTEYPRLESFCKLCPQENVKLLKYLPKGEYSQLVLAADVGLIFLDHRFTIPNFPSRLLDYMQMGLPVLACTDKNTDVGEVITENGFGWWCESRDVKDFTECVQLAIKADRITMGDRAYEHLKAEYDVKKVVDVLVDTQIK